MVLGRVRGRRALAVVPGACACACVLVALVALVASCSTSPTLPPGPPRVVGTLEPVVRTPAGGLRIAGWAADNHTRTPVRVAVTVNGTTVATATAKEAYADLAHTHRVVGDDHGFDVTVPASAGAQANGSEGTGTVVDGLVCVSAARARAAPTPIGCRRAPGGRTRDGVVVPSSPQIDWDTPVAVTMTGVRAYADPPGDARCRATTRTGRNPLTDPVPAGAGAAADCLAWFSPGPGPHPTIVWVHGGGWSTAGALPVPGPVLQYVQKGWTVVAVQYRFATCGSDQFPTAVRDVQRSIAYIRDHAAAMDVDPDRIVAFGHSAGAQIAALVGTGWNDRSGYLLTGARYAVAGWVALSGLEDVRYFAAHSSFVGPIYTYLPSDPQTPAACAGPPAWRPADALLDAASPVHQLDRDDPPGFVIHGGSDSVTPAGPAPRAMGAAMAAAGRPDAVWNEVVPGGGHNPAWNPVWMDSFLAQAVEHRDPRPPVFQVPGLVSPRA